MYAGDRERETSLYKMGHSLAGAQRTLQLPTHWSVFVSPSLLLLDYSQSFLIYLLTEYQ
jgi:hypothetical protein